MKTKKFIRLEHQVHGTGIFVSQWDDNGDECWSVYNDDSSLMVSVRQRHNKFPTPMEEGYCFEYDEFCGFKNVEQLDEWFNKMELRYMVKKGIRIYSITVFELTFEGEYQVMYRKEDVFSRRDITNKVLNSKKKPVKKKRKVVKMN